MACDLADRCLRSACQMSGSRGAGTLFATCFLCLIVFSGLLSGCSPYPIYSTSRPSLPQSHDLTEPDQTAPGESELQPRESSTSIDNGTPSVQPAIFAQVVEEYLGSPYARGGDDASGIDCSHLVRALFRDYDGTRLPANTNHLYKLPRTVTSDLLEVGDLVFFKFDESDVSHVGVYLGDGRFVHASEKRGVIISDLDDPTYRDRYVGARRVM